MKRFKKCCDEVRTKALLILLTKIGSLPDRTLTLNRSEAQIALNLILESNNLDEMLNLLSPSEKEMFSYLEDLWKQRIWKDQIQQVDEHDL